MRSLVFAVVLASVACSCGPSYQAVNECDARFEHCYALDLTSGAPPGGRRTCWHDWLRGYTYGQSRDRVEYAATRLSQLSLESTVAHDNPQGGQSVLDGGSRPGISAPTMLPSAVPSAAPGPTSLAATSPMASVPPAPGIRCVETCALRWRDCREACSEPCVGCDKSYRVCASACFREDARMGQPTPSAIR